MTARTRVWAAAVVMSMGAMGIAAAGCEAFTDCQESRTCEGQEGEDEEADVAHVMGGQGGQGGQGGRGPGAAQAPPRAPAAPTLEFGLKVFSFSWEGVSQADSYRIEYLEGSDWVVVAETPEVHFDLEVALHLLAWPSPTYRVAACNAGGCAASPEVVVNDAAAASIGYFKRTSLMPAFGEMFALDREGQTLAVASRSSLAVLIYRRVDGAWEQDAILESNSGEIRTFALSGDGKVLALGGAYSSSTGGGSTVESIHVFERGPTGWVALSPILVPTDMTSWKPTSISLSDNGSTLALGLPDNSRSSGGGGGLPGPSTLGWVGVYERVGVIYQSPQWLGALGTPTLGSFGKMVRLSGDGKRLAVANPIDKSGAIGINGDWADESLPSSGGVFLYTKSSGVWALEAYFKASNADSSDQFGASIALDAAGERLVVGAPGEAGDGTGTEADSSSNAASKAGAAYVFHRSGETWLEEAYLKASNTGAGDNFYRVTIDDAGATVAVGADAEESTGLAFTASPGNDSGAQRGAVYVFVRDGSTWKERNYLKPSGAVEQHRFGPVELSGDGLTLAVAAPGDRGAAFGVGGDPLNQTGGTAGAIFLY